jgi:large subunit ribosomal protein L33
MREKIKLVSSAGDGDFYTTFTNKKNNKEKLKLKKYNRKLRRHIEYKQDSIK